MQKEFIIYKALSDQKSMTLFQVNWLPITPPEVDYLLLINKENNDFLRSGTQQEAGGDSVPGEQVLDVQLKLSL